MADVIQNIRQAYRSLLQNDSQLSQLRNRLMKGDLAALQKYSMRAGQLAVRALQESVSNESIDQSSVENALDAVFRENYDAVVNASSAAQKALNQNSGIGLNASDSDYSGENVQALADRLNSYDDLSEGLSSISNDIVMQSQRYADDSERRSAQFDNDSGLEVLVSREYDDVGVHTTDKDGGKPCQWCLDRCGTDVPYEEAYEMGMFERHPGCGCIITYKTKKGIYRQGKGDWQDNSWNEVPDSVRERRIRFSEKQSDIIQFPKSVGSRWKNYDVKDLQTGDIYHFVEGSSIRNPTTFAGYGTGKPLREAVKKGLSDQYPGTDPEKWEHRKGSGHLDVDGVDTLAEVHWFQQPGIKCGFKVKNWLE